MQDLFITIAEHPEQIGDDLLKVVEKYSKFWEHSREDYRVTERFLKECQRIGYTFDYYLDNTPYGLRPIGVSIEEIEGIENI